MTAHRMTKDERITRLETEVQTLKLQVRTLLKSHQSSIEQSIKLTEVVTEMAEAQASMERKFKQQLVARSVQMVLDSMDADEPTPADVWDHDIERLNLPYTPGAVLRVEDSTKDVW